MRSARSLTLSRRIPRTPPRHRACPPYHHGHNPATMHTPHHHACPPPPCTPPAITVISAPAEGTCRRYIAKKERAFPLWNNMNENHSSLSFSVNVPLMTRHKLGRIPPLTCFAAWSNRFLRFTSCVTPADHLVASVADKLLQSHTCIWQDRRPTDWVTLTRIKKRIHLDTFPANFKGMG